MATVSSSTQLISLEGVALDIIGTALDARSARLVQVAGLRIKGEKQLSDERYEALVNPRVEIPQESTAGHGLTDADVAAAPDFADVAAGLDDFLDGSIVVAHNVDYDLSLLQAEHDRAGLVWRAPRAVDVGLLARVVAPTLSHYGLRQLCEWLRIPLEPTPSLMRETEAVAQIYAALVPRLRNMEIRTLAEAEAACRALSEARVDRIVTSDQPGAVPAESSRPRVRLDSFPYRHRVHEVMAAPLVVLPASATVREGIALLLKRKISSILVTDDGQQPMVTGNGAGIVTERDALRAISQHQAAALDMPLSAFAVRPVQTVSANAFLYRAIGRMDRLGFRHLGVRDDHGRIVGMVTPRNLLRQRSSTALMLGDEIDAAPDEAALAAAWSKLPAMAKALVEDDVDPRTVAAVASSEIGLLTRRAAQLAEQSLLRDGWGAPPVPFAVMVLGSGGRGESLLAADQDNAIVYAAGEPGGPEDKWCEELGRRMADMLDASGVPYCKGGIMAKNTAWRHSVAGWRDVINGWVIRQRPDDLLNVDIFFDGIPVHGDVELAEAIWTHAYDVGHRAPDFIKLMTALSRQWHAPFNLFGGIKTDHGRADLKIGGLMPIFGGARVLSIRHDVRARSTPERLRGLLAQGIGSAKDVEAVIDAHRVILGAVLDQQLIDSEQGVALSTKVEIGRLDKKQLQTLKDALHQVDLIVNMVSEGRV